MYIYYFKKIRKKKAGEGACSMLRCLCCHLSRCRCHCCCRHCGWCCHSLLRCPAAAGGVAGTVATLLLPAVAVVVVTIAAAAIVAVALLLLLSLLLLVVLQLQLPLLLPCCCRSCDPLVRLPPLSPSFFHPCSHLRCSVLAFICICITCQIQHS